MKTVIIFFCCLLLVSCKAIKQISNEEILMKSGCEKLIFNGKSLLFPLEIENKKATFIFDTGATVTALLDSTIIDNFGEKDFSKFGSAKGANGKKIQNKRFTANIKSNVFESSNKILTFINMPISRCEKQKSVYTGILGLDVFFDKNLSMQLDFTNNKVCNITDQQFQQILVNDQYQLLESKCRMNQITVYLNIEGKKHPFKLDTGYTGNIIMPFDENLDFKNEKMIALEGSLFQTISSHTTGKEVIYEKMPIVFGSYNLQAKVNVSTSIKAQNIGITFIKAFDWLIDYNNNKVYIKRNQNPIESNFNRKVSYYAKVNQDRLQVVVKEKSQTKYQLGDQIIAVNGQKVTTENQCDLQDLLNKTDDWDTLQLEVVSSPK